MTSVLFVVTGASEWTLADGTKHPTGFWAEELVAPHQVFTEAGFDVTFATPDGVAPTVDRNSLSVEMNGGDEQKVTELRDYLAAIDDRLSAPESLAGIDPDRFDVLFVPGGHGPMEDLAVSEDMRRILIRMHDTGKTLSAVCHAPAALLAARRDDGSWVFDGYDLTGFTNEEETQAGLAEYAAWLLEDRLTEAGAAFRSGAAWAPYLVSDRTLHTGQNPASSGKLAEHVVSVAR
ncbi:type 1 glutamine amidotransferase domain-containing protein [Parasphingorhabdus pacifica]